MSDYPYYPDRPPCRRVAGRASGFLGRHAIRDNIDDTPPSPSSEISVDPPRISTRELRRRRENMPVVYSASDSVEEPTATPAPTRVMDWPQDETDAIQQRRGTTTVSSRSGGRERTRHHERQTRNTARLSLSSEESHGSSDDSEVLDKKSGDATTYLRYLVRRFLRQFRAAREEDDGIIKLASKESFIPSPKITFLIDKPDNLICQIDQQTPLKLATMEASCSPSTIMIFPCGHIACSSCAKMWMSNHNSCPFCRTSMVHTGCKHNVQLRIIAQDTIHTLPDTIPQGGKIASLCMHCAEWERRQASVVRWTELADRFKEARREAESSGTEEAVAEMVKAKTAFERLPEDDFWVLSKLKHRQW